MDLNLKKEIMMKTGMIPKTAVAVMSILCGVTLSAGNFVSSDDFSKYADGALPASSWQIDKADSWTIASKKLIATSPGTALFAFPAGAIVSNDVEVEAFITPEASAADGWKTIGIMVLQDAKNYWALSLVARPANDKVQTPFMELSQMNNAVWNAQSTGDKKLKTSIDKNINPKWEYGKTYKLKLKLSSTAIYGAIYDSAGTLLFEREYQLAADKSVMTGKPGIRVNGLKSAVLSFTCAAKGN